VAHFWRHRCHGAADARAGVDPPFAGNQRLAAGGERYLSSYPADKPALRFKEPVDERLKHLQKIKDNRLRPPAAGLSGARQRRPKSDGVQTFTEECARY